MNNNLKNINLIIHNILRSLGIKTSNKGGKLLSKAIQIVATSNEDFFVYEKLYLIIADYYSLSSSEVNKAIRYALDSRIEKPESFKRIFGFEYDDYFFTNKNFIDEIANIIKCKNLL